MITSRRPVFVVALAFSILLLAPAFTATAAQDASPAAADCPATTVEENIALVQEAQAAIANADADAIDQILADDFTHNQDRYGLPDDPASNEDEIGLATQMQGFYPGSTHEITEVFGADNKVVVESVWTITEHNITGETVVLDEAIEVRSIAIFTIECGEVASLNVLVDGLTLLVGLGVYPPLPIMEATPAA